MRMKKAQIKEYNYHFNDCSTTEGVHSFVAGIFKSYSSILPKKKGARILIKPNLNSNMNSLTGNTTDLRVLAAVLHELAKRKYTDIIVGEGTSSGFYRYNIDVANRLKVKELISQFRNVSFVDLNYDDTFTIDFEDGVKANISKLCVESDFFINLPKIKMHYETMMTVCLKSLIGCLVGLNEKQKAHFSLFRNIIHLNENIRPDLTIVDGLISMEGTGPSLGTPRKTDIIMAGRDPFLLDLLCTKIAGIHPFRPPVLRIAKSLGYIDTKDITLYRKFKPHYIRRFNRPTPTFLARWINDQRWQKYFILLRIGSLDWFFNLDIVGNFLNMAGLRQDIFSMENQHIESVKVNNERCDGCKACESYCPVKLKLKDMGDLKKGCFNCLYCQMVCPLDAIEIKGELGFIKIQNEMYNDYIKDIGAASIPRKLQPLVTIVIPTYNSARTIGRCILNCQRQSYKNIEIIVVDNKSNDATVAIAEELGVKVYTHGPERAAQRNFGAKKGKGDYLIFVDSDIYLSREVVKECIESRTDVITFREFIHGHGFWTSCRKIEAQCYFGDDTIEAPRFYSRRAFDHIRGFDEDIRLTGTEDWNLRERAIGKGYRIMRVKAPTFHDEGRTSLGKRVKNKMYYSQSFNLYNQKHRGKSNIPFLRGCYLRNWKLLLMNPIRTIGFFIMKFAEGVSVFYMMKFGRRKLNKRDIYR